MTEIDMTGNYVFPLKLERYFFTKTVCAATPGYVGEGTSGGMVNVKTSIMGRKNDPLRWKIHLAIALSEKTDRRSVPYDFTLGLEGFFLLGNETDKQGGPCDSFASMVYVRGASMLYAIATEYMRNITSAGPYGQFILPDHIFSPMDLGTAKKGRIIN